MLLHGATAGLRYFESQLTGLSNEFRALAADFRGHGRSEMTELGHTFGQYARDVRAFLERLELEQVVLGNPFGPTARWSVVWQRTHQRTARPRGIDTVSASPS